MAVLADREGAAFCVWEAKEHRGAQIVNEPGSWNWSDLTTRDHEAARAFYGAVFGWETDAFDPEGGATVRLPGYGDFLERRDPGLRDRLAEYRRPRASGTRSPGSRPRRMRTRRRTGASRCPSTTRTRPPSGRGSWAAT
jgi:hypothetical protein